MSHGTRSSYRMGGWGRGGHVRWTQVDHERRERSCRALSCDMGSWNGEQEESSGPGRRGMRWPETRKIRPGPRALIGLTGPWHDLSVSGHEVSFWAAELVDFRHEPSPALRVTPLNDEGRNP